VYLEYHAEDGEVHSFYC